MVPGAAVTTPRDHAVILPRGAVAEWFQAAVLKTAGRKPRGFESLPLRHDGTR